MKIEAPNSRKEFFINCSTDSCQNFNDIVTFPTTSALKHKKYPKILYDDRELGKVSSYVITVVIVFLNRFFSNRIEITVFFYM